MVLVEMLEGMKIALLLKGHVFLEIGPVAYPDDVLTLNDRATNEHLHNLRVERSRRLNTGTILPPFSKHIGNNDGGVSGRKGPSAELLMPIIRAIIAVPIFLLKEYVASCLHVYFSNREELSEFNSLYLTEWGMVYWKEINTDFWTLNFRLS